MNYFVEDRPERPDPLAIAVQSVIFQLNLRSPQLFLETTVTRSRADLAREEGRKE